MILRCASLISVALLFLVSATEPDRFEEAAQQLDEQIASNYAYLDELPYGKLPVSHELERRRGAVSDSRSLLSYAEARMASLADHHAMTGSSFADSWAVVPTYADLWLVERHGRVLVDAVRANSPADAAQIAVGDRIVSVDGVPIENAIYDFWANLGLKVTPSRADYAARVLLAGRRDRPRRFAVEDASGKIRQLTLQSLYDLLSEGRDPISVCSFEDRSVVRFNNSLGDNATIAAFDEALRAIPEENELFLDLRDTPSGGNTTIARAIMGWFVDEARDYQVHNRPAEQRETGVARQWVEQVLPREDKHRSELPTLLVGRWTGSMGEGLAIGFAALGADVRGTRMAGLQGSIEDLRVGDTDLFVKLPTERLYTVEGLPRENFVPQPSIEEGPLSAGC